VVVLTLCYCFAFTQQQLLVLKGIMVINPTAQESYFQGLAFAK